MTKQKVIEAIKGIYFQDEEVQIGNLKLYSFMEEGDWGIGVADEDYGTYFYFYPGCAEITAPEVIYDCICNDFDWKF